MAKSKKNTKKKSVQFEEGMTKSSTEPYGVTSKISLVREKVKDSPLPFRTECPNSAYACTNLYVYNAITNKAYKTPIRSMNFVKLKNSPPSCTLIYLGSFVLSSSNADNYILGSKHETVSNLMYAMNIVY